MKTEIFKKLLKQCKANYVSDLNFTCENFNLKVSKYLVMISTENKIFAISETSLTTPIDITFQELEQICDKLERDLSKIAEKHKELNQMFCEHPYEKVQENECKICKKFFPKI
jgi:hypothetical protein